MKIFLKILLVITVTLVLSVSVFADNEADTSENIYAASLLCGDVGVFDGFDIPSDTSLLTEASSKPETEGARVTSFTTHGDDTFIRIFMENGASRLDMNYPLKGSENDDDGEGVSLSGNLVFGVYVMSSSQELLNEIIPFEITLKGEDSTYHCKVLVPYATPAMIYADLSDIPKDTKITDITLSLLKNRDFGGVVNIITTHPGETDRMDFTFQRSSGLMWMSFIKGNAQIKDDKMVLGTDAENVTIQAVPEIKGDRDTETLYRAYCSIGCSDGNGNVSISAKDSNTVSAQHSVSPDGGYALVRFSHKTGDEITLDFKSGAQTEITLDHLAFQPTTEVDSFSSSSITNLSYSEGKLVAEGKLSGSIVSTYPRESLGLYKLSPATGISELIGKVDITSRFSITVDLKDQPHTGWDNLFYVSVIDSESNELLRVGDPRFVSSSSAKSPGTSDFGLYGANPISVYESGASHILLDVDLSKLITASASSSITVSRGKYVFGINTDYLKEIDSEMSFYRSSGVGVYARLVCKNYIISSVDSSWLTYHVSRADEVLLRADHPEALNMYMATVSFLCQRYPNISSFVISSGINSEAFTGITADDPYDYASQAAIIARLVYNAAAEASENVTVTMPVLLSGADVSVPAEIFSALFAEKISSVGNISWSIMYYTDSSAPSVPAENISSTARINGTAGPSFTTVMWSPKTDDGSTVSKYKDFCLSCSMTSVKLVFLSAKDSHSQLSRDDFTSLKKLMFGDSSALMDSIPKSLEEVYSEPVNGVFTLWDFADSYSPEGWNGGYGIASIMSSAENASLISGNRVLRCITEGTASSPAGIILCSPESPLNFSASPLVEFVFSCNADDDAQIIFVFANGTSRAEFSFTDTTSYMSDGKLHAVCDLSEFSDVSSVSYVGVIIYSSSPVTFDLSKVNALSRTADVGEIEIRIFGGQSAPISDKKPPVKEVVFVLGALALVIISSRIASSLKKCDKKHKEEMDALKSSKKRRI